MKPRFLAALFPLLAFPAFAEGPAAAASDDEVEARKVALELAGAFANEGFKLRDGHFSGPIKPGEAKLVQVNLYAGNEYYFSVAATEKAKKMVITLFDEAGSAITIEDPFQEGAKAAVGFSPETSGPYYVKVEEIEGEATSFCLVCSYK
jgi:hypothetical protein